MHLRQFTRLWDKQTAMDVGRRRMHKIPTNKGLSVFLSTLRYRSTINKAKNIMIVIKIRNSVDGANVLLHPSSISQIRFFCKSNSLFLIGAT